MATLRDFVSEKELKFPNQGGYWTKCELSDSGYQGDSGPELGDTFFNFEKHFMYNGTEFTYKLEQTWSKINSFPEPVPQEYYPIISIFLDIDNQTVPGCEYVVGYNQWWDYTIKRVQQEGTTIEIRDDFVTGGFANYKLDTKISGDLAVTGYSANEYEFSQYYDSEHNYVTEGFDVVARPAYAPMYDTYWYKEGAYANLLYGRSWSQPQYITGNPSYGDYTLQFANPFDCNNQQAYTENTPMLLSLDTNVPIIVWDYNYYNAHTNDISNLMKNYKEDGDLTRFSTYVTNGNCVIANGYVAPSVTEGTKQYNMYCDVYNGYWDVDEPSNETFREYRYLEVWVAPTTTQQTDARASLYKAPYGNELRCNIKVYGDIKQYRYSTDGGNSWTVVTAETSSQTLTLPWEYLYYKRTDELRWLTYDKNHGGNMLLFDTEALADDGSPWLASDYNEKNFYYPTTNETGTPENSTLMGTTGLASVFSKKYVVNYSDLITIANALFSSGGMVEDLKKGLEMFGDPIQAIQGLMYVPVDCADYFSLVTSSTVILGGYEIPNTNAKLLTRFNGYFDVGSLEIKESFPSGDYRNQEPYCMLNIFLPFVGLETLKLNKYVGKTLSIRYYLDATTGECMACLFADGLLSDYFTGQMGVNLPISLHDYAQFAGASMQALAGIAEGGANALIGTATGDVGRVAQGVTGFEGSMFNLKQNSINNFVTTKGTSSSLLNHFLPNYVYVIFEIIETDETPNLLTVEGRRTNASGNIGAFSGFLQVESVKLNCSGATENEKSKIKDLLSAGIYI